MFDALAGRYDLMNDVLSMGQVRLWRRRVQRILQAGPGDRVLDLAAGTGTSSVTLRRNRRRRRGLRFLPRHAARPARPGR